MRSFTAVTVLALCLSSPSAFAGSDKNYTYLALGDSVPFGFNPLLLPPFSPPPPPSADQYVGYPEILSALPGINHINASCPGESSGSFMDVKVADFGCNSPHLSPPAPPFKQIGLHVNYSGSQMAFAMSQLATNKKINLVTLTIGSNDVLLVLQQCGAACKPEDFGPALEQYGKNLAAILLTLRSQYKGNLILVGYYSPSPELDGLTQAVNGVMQQVAGDLAQHVMGFVPVKYADSFAAFQATEKLLGKSDACSAGLVWRLPTDPPSCDIHPTKFGQTVIAGAVGLAH